MKVLYNEEGLTLLELVITLTIVAFLLASIYGVMGGSFKVWQQGSEKAELQQNARIAMNMLEMDIRRASKVGSDSKETSLYLDLDGNKIRYYLLGEQLLKSKHGQGNNPVAHNFSKLQFIYYPSKSSCTLVEIYMEFEKLGYVYKLSSKLNVRGSGF